MRRLRLFSILVVVLLLAGSLGVAADTRTYTTHLTGDNENPPNASAGQGQFQLRLSADGLTATFKLNIANIENVQAAHIHIAAVGVNGPVVVPLYVAGLIPGRFQGTLAEGSFTSLSGPLAGQPLSALVAAIAAGNAYVNVHTQQLPGGEIRGQLR